MAQLLKLTWDTTDLSFLAGSSGFQLAGGGWLPRVSVEGEPVTEELRLLLERDSVDNLAASMQALAEMQRYAAAYVGDSWSLTPVWLYAQLKNESYTRRALVRRMAYSFAESWYSGVTAGELNTVISLSLERGAFWESNGALSGPAKASAAGIVITYNPNSAITVTGDVRARFYFLEVVNKTATTTLDRFWIAIRSANKHGTLANFEPIWELEDGTLYNSAALATGSTASPGTVPPTTTNVVKAANSSEEKLVMIKMADVTANYSDNYGLFLWLLRAKVTAGTWNVRLRWGYSGQEDDDFVYGRPVEIASTNWNLYALGVHAMPPRPAKADEVVYGGDNGQASIQVWAETTSGTGSLALDCLVVVPVDEGYAFVEGAGLTDDEDRLFLGETEVGEYIAMSMLGTSYQNAQAEMVNFGLQPGDNYVFIVLARESESVLTDRIEIETAGCRWFTRWRSLAGSDLDV